MENIVGSHYAIINSIPNIKERGEYMTTEDLSSVLITVKNYFTKLLPSAKGAYDSNASRLANVDKNQYNAFIRNIVDMEKDIKKIENVRFSNVELVKVPVMVGMKNDLLTTVSKLKEASDLINMYLRTSIEYTDIMIALTLSDKDFREASRLNYARIKQQFKAVNKRIEFSHNDIYELYYKLDNIISDIIDPKLHSDQRKVNELIPNISTLYSIHNTILMAAKGNTFEEAKSIKDEVVIISERADALYHMLTEEDDFTISKPVINELAAVLEDTGKTVTSSITIWHMINQMATTLSFLITAINKAK